MYYETLVTGLKQLGLKTEVISYEELRLEKQKQTLYGLIETAALLNTRGEPGHKIYFIFILSLTL